MHNLPFQLTKGILVAVHFGERKDKCCKKEDMKELLRKSLV